MGKDYAERVELQKEQLHEELHELYEYFLNKGAAPYIAAASAHYAASRVTLQSHNAPSQRQVAERYGTANSTIRKYWKILEDDVEKSVDGDGTLEPIPSLKFRHVDEWNDIDPKNTNYRGELRESLIKKVKCIHGIEGGPESPLTKSNLFELTGAESELELVEILRGWGLTEEMAPVSVSINKDGLRKLIELAD